VFTQRRTPLGVASTLSCSSLRDSTCMTSSSESRLSRVAVAAVTGVVSIPNRVQYSHASLVGTAEDLLSQTTKSKDHVMSQVIWIMCEIT
jgi:hypothetical protein